MERLGKRKKEARTPEKAYLTRDAYICIHSGSQEGRNKMKDNTISRTQIFILSKERIMEGPTATKVMSSSRPMKRFGARVKF